MLQEQAGGTQVTLTITRGDKGTFGDLEVYWEVDGAMDDISPSSGTVEFISGQTTGEIFLTIQNDLVST